MLMTWIRIHFFSRLIQDPDLHHNEIDSKNCLFEKIYFKK